MRRPGGQHAGDYVGEVVLRIEAVEPGSRSRSRLQLYGSRQHSSQKNDNSCGRSQSCVSMKMRSWLISASRSQRRHQDRRVDGPLLLRRRLTGGGAKS
jgi:hypothetical protein